jgi:hypothetical protein
VRRPSTPDWRSSSSAARASQASATSTRALQPGSGTLSRESRAAWQGQEDRWCVCVCVKGGGMCPWPEQSQRHSCSGRTQQRQATPPEQHQRCVSHLRPCTMCDPSAPSSAAVAISSARLARLVFFLATERRAASSHSRLRRAWRATAGGPTVQATGSPACRDTSNREIGKGVLQTRAPRASASW